jgi:hypothetical protein
MREYARAIVRSHVVHPHMIVRSPDMHPNTRFLSHVMRTHMDSA